MFLNVKNPKLFFTSNGKFTIFFGTDKYLYFYSLSYAILQISHTLQIVPNYNLLCGTVAYFDEIEA